jgi:hypothetical protein
VSEEQVFLEGLHLLVVEVELELKRPIGKPPSLP